MLLFVRCCAHTVLSAPRRKSSSSLGQFRSRLGGLITLPSPPLLPYPSISGASCPDTLGGSVQPLYDLLILSHAVVGLLGILSGASPRSEDLEQKTLLSVNNCILSCQWVANESLVLRSRWGTPNACPFDRCTSKIVSITDWSVMIMYCSCNFEPMLPSNLDGIGNLSGIVRPWTNINRHKGELPSRSARFDF